jgi:hypothetical protein
MFQFNSVARRRFTVKTLEDRVKIVMHISDPFQASFVSIN